MTRTALPACLLAATFIGCSTAPPARLVLLNRATGSRHVGTVVASDREASMTASIDIDGVAFHGKFVPSPGDAVVNFLGSGAELMHCTFHFEPGARTGIGECVQAGSRRFDATLSD